MGTWRIDLSMTPRQNDLHRINDPDLRFAVGLLTGQFDGLNEKLDEYKADLDGLAGRVHLVEVRPVFSEPQHTRLARIADRSHSAWRWTRYAIESAIAAGCVIGGTELLKILKFG
jgi:hypothetical protein